VRKPQHQAKAQSTTKTIVPVETRKLSINVPDRVVRPLYVSIAVSVLHMLSLGECTVRCRGIEQPCGWGFVASKTGRHAK